MSNAKISLDVEHEIKSVIYDLLEKNVEGYDTENVNFEKLIAIHKVISEFIIHDKAVHEDLTKK